MSPGNFGVFVPATRLLGVRLLCISLLRGPRGHSRWRVTTHHLVEEDVVAQQSVAASGDRPG
ncbi:MAG: hypothetical protein ACYC3V_13110, partial [Chloroflexota bacterium]